MVFGNVDDIQAFPPPRPVPVRKLSYCTDTPLAAFRPLLLGHGSEETQILPIDGDVAAP
jgi:hypothetical protein